MRIGKKMMAEREETAAQATTTMFPRGQKERLGVGDHERVRKIWNENNKRSESLCLEELFDDLVLRNLGYIGTSVV